MPSSFGLLERHECSLGAERPNPSSRNHVPDSTENILISNCVARKHPPVLVQQPQHGIDWEPLSVGFRLESTTISSLSDDSEDSEPDENEDSADVASSFLLLTPRDTSSAPSSQADDRVESIIQQESAAIEDLQHLIVVLAVTDVVVMLYSILSTTWYETLGIGVVVGVVASNAFFLFTAKRGCALAVKGMSKVSLFRQWEPVVVMVFMPLNAASIFDKDCPDVLLARLLIVIAQMVVLARVRSLNEMSLYAL